MKENILQSLLEAIRVAMREVLGESTELHIQGYVYDLEAPSEDRDGWEVWIVEHKPTEPTDLKAWYLSQQQRCLLHIDDTFYSEVWICVVPNGIEPGVADRIRQCVERYASENGIEVTWDSV